MRSLLATSLSTIGMLGCAFATSAGCAAGGNASSASSGSGAGGGGLGGAPSTSTAGSTTSGTEKGSGGFQGTGSGGGTSGAAGGPSCAKFTKAASQAPAALLIVLDKSASMNVKIAGVSKWQSAVHAITTAINYDVFDGMSLGLVTFPDGEVPKPACLKFATNVSCGFAMTPQVPLADAGTLKTTDLSGVRHDIGAYLAGNEPLNNLDDGSPDYDALNAAYAALKAYANVSHRAAVLVSDGGFSCTSLSNPTRPGFSDGECPDWEEPPTVNALISGAYGDPTQPINTFIVGVPGSNSHKGQNTGLYAVPPYSMLLALSSYAVSGSPNTVDPTCDKTLMFQPPPAGVDPTHPCHIDLSSNAAFNSTTLAKALSQIRGQALGCVYQLPAAPMGQTIDPNLVNVLVTTDGTQTTVPRRKNASDTCPMGCWDYDSMQNVELLGQACTEVEVATMASIDIEVGCKTIVK